MKQAHIAHLSVGGENVNVSANLPYADYGYIPGVAQAAQNAALYENPHIRPQPYFSTEQLAIANWFTTRVHLSPLGKALSDETY